MLLIKYITFLLSFLLIPISTLVLLSYHYIGPGQCELHSSYTPTLKTHQHTPIYGSCHNDIVATGWQGHCSWTQHRTSAHEHQRPSFKGTELKTLLIAIQGTDMSPEQSPSQNPKLPFVFSLRCFGGRPALIKNGCLGAGEQRGGVRLASGADSSLCFTEL